MNKVIIKGRLSKDVELKTTPNGVEVANTSVAVDRNYTTKGEEKQTDFFNVTAWRQTGVFLDTYFKKGQEILIDGEMQSRKYTDKDGNNRISWDLVANKIEFCGSKSNSSNSTAPNVSTDDFEEISMGDEDLPF